MAQQQLQHSISCPHCLTLQSSATALVGHLMRKECCNGFSEEQINLQFEVNLKLCQSCVTAIRYLTPDVKCESNYMIFSFCKQCAVLNKDIPPKLISNGTADATA